MAAASKGAPSRHELTRGIRKAARMWTHFNPVHVAFASLLRITFESLLPSERSRDAILESTVASFVSREVVVQSQIDRTINTEAAVEPRAGQGSTVSAGQAEAHWDHSSLSCSVTEVIIILITADICLLTTSFVAVSFCRSRTFTQTGLCHISLPQTVTPPCLHNTIPVSTAASSCPFRMSHDADHVSSPADHGAEELSAAADVCTSSPDVLRAYKWRSDLSPGK